MTPQEAQIIRSVFDRLKAMEAGPRDAEAEALVEALLKADPQAGLGLVRALVMTDRARGAAVEEAEAAKHELEALRSSQPAQPTSGGGLFGGLFGGGAPAPAPQSPMSQSPMPQAGPWGARPQAGPQAGPWDAQPQQQGSGFWGSALRTGAGVAGGLFAFEAVRGLLGGGSHGGWGGGWGGGPTAGFFDQPTTVVNETVNVFEGDRSQSLPSGVFDAPGALDDRGGGWSDASFSDGGGFGGDDDDLA